MAWRMLVSLTVSLAASYYVAGRLGQPVLLGMAAGGVLGLISSFMVGDVPVAQMAARVGWHVVPYAAGLGLGLFLGADRPLVMAGLVPVIFLQFYLDRLGPYSHLFGDAVRLVPHRSDAAPGLGAYPDLVIIGAASAGACIIGRALLCWHNPAREMRQTLRAYHAASRRAAARLAQFLESGCTPHSGRRLDRALDHVNTVVLANAVGSMAALAPVVKPILLTRVLTTTLDEHGCHWNRSRPMCRLSRSYRSSWTAADISDLATDRMLPEVSASGVYPLDGKDEGAHSHPLPTGHLSRDGQALSPESANSAVS